MKEIAESVHGVKGTHDVRLRKSGPVFFGEMHMELQEGLSLEKAPCDIRRSRDRIKERFKDLELVTVHVGLAHRKKTNCDSNNRRQRIGFICQSPFWQRSLFCLHRR